MGALIKQFIVIYLVLWIYSRKKINLDNNRSIVLCLPYWVRIGGIKMSSTDEYKKTTNANSYNSLAVVVKEIQTQKVGDNTLVFAVGVLANDQKQEVAVQMMNDERLRVHFAQMNGVAWESEKNGDLVYTTRGDNKGVRHEISKQDYDNLIQSDYKVDSKLRTHYKQFQKADNIAAKMKRTTMPCVMYFDFANQTNEISGMKFYEAKWIANASGDASQSLENDSDFNTLHRKGLSSIHIKYDQETLNPYWAELRVVDRIANISIPKPDFPNAKETYEQNRDIIMTGLTNIVQANNGMSAERNAITYINVVNTKTQKKDTINIYQETSQMTRKEAGSIIEHKYNVPKTASETLIAYFNQQDKSSIDLKIAMQEKQPIDMYMVDKAINSDKVRAFLSASMGLQFKPLVDDAVVKAAPSILQKEIAIAKNTVVKLHNDIQNGDALLKSVNCSVYPIGDRYRERLLQNLNADKPVAGMLEMKAHQIDPSDPNSLVKQYNSHVTMNKENRVIFSEGYISIKRQDESNQLNSTFIASYIHPIASSKDEVVRNRLYLDALIDRHAPTQESFLFVTRDHSEKPARNAFDVIQNEIKVINEMEDRKAFKVANEKLMRLVGTQVPEQPKTKEERKEKIAERDMGFSLEH